MPKWIEDAWVVQELIRWAMPLVFAWLLSRMNRLLKDWAGLYDQVKRVDERLNVVDAKLSKLESHVTAGFGAIQAQVRHQDQGVQQLNVSIQRLRVRMARNSRAQERRMARGDERLSAILRMIAPERAEAMLHDWARQDAADRREFREEEGDEED